jgi:hypothetical protein
MGLRSHRYARRVIVASSGVCLAACLATVSPDAGVHASADAGGENVAIEGAAAVVDAGADDAIGLAEDAVADADDADAGADDANDANDAEACLRGFDAASLTVGVETLTTSVSPCPAGYGHPNVCCWTPSSGTSAPATMPLCFEYEGLPFQECGCGALTFPDPRACCPLDARSACIATPVLDDASQEAGDAAPPGSADGGAGCYLPCGPGGYFPPTDIASTPACSAVPQDADGGSCFYCCSNSRGCISNFCGCNLVGPDAQPCRCGPQCDACPDGWQTPAGTPDLCCRSDAGSTQCFSQANQILAGQ